MTLERVSVAHREASRANTRVRGRCSREGRWHEREKGEREVKARLPLAWTSARLLHAFISNRSPSPFPPPRTCGSQFQVHRPRSGAGAVLIHVPHRTPIRSSAGLAVRCCFVACLLLRDSATCVSCRPFVPRLFVRKSREDRQQHPWLEELSVSLAPSPTCLSQSATAEENVHVAEAHALFYAFRELWLMETCLGRNATFPPRVRRSLSQPSLFTRGRHCRRPGQLRWRSQLGEPPLRLARPSPSSRATFNF